MSLWEWLPVWMAQFMNRGASFSRSHPWRAACIQGIWNILFSCREKAKQHVCLCVFACLHGCLSTVLCSLTLLTHFRPGIKQELICSSSQGRMRILSTGMVACRHGRKDGHKTGPSVRWPDKDEYAVPVWICCPCLNTLSLSDVNSDVTTAVASRSFKTVVCYRTSTGVV